MSDHTDQPAVSPDADTNPSSPQGGTKDTNDLTAVAQVQKKGMQEKADQVSKLPDNVTGANTGIPPERQ